MQWWYVVWQSTRHESSRRNDLETENSVDWTKKTYEAAISASKRRVASFISINFLCFAALSASADMCATVSLTNPVEGKPVLKGSNPRTPFVKPSSWMGLYTSWGCINGGNIQSKLDSVLCDITAGSAMITESGAMGAESNEFWERLNSNMEGSNVGNEKAEDFSTSSKNGY